MTPEYDVQAGVLANDKETDDDDSMLIISVSEASCDDEDEAFVKWDYNMNAKTVADENKEYGYSPEQPFAEVAFVSYLDRKWPDWKYRNLDFLQELVAEEELKPYKYPVNRLQVTGQRF